MLNDVIYRWHEKYADENGVSESSFSEMADELLVTEDELRDALDDMYPELYYHWVDGLPERTIRIFFPER